MSYSRIAFSTILAANIVRAHTPSAACSHLIFWVELLIRIV